MRWIEAIVSFLTPPACREEVVGDLRERFVSIGQYIAEAICTIVAVIWSRIRRTSDPAMLLMEGMVLYASFVLPAWASRTFLNEDWALVRLVLPVVAAVFVLVLVDAYAIPGKRSALRPLRDTVFGLMAACAAAACWGIPVKIMLLGSGMSVLLVSGLRMLFAADGNRPRGAT